MRGTVTDTGAGMENRRISELPGADYMANETFCLPTGHPRFLPRDCGTLNFVADRESLWRGPYKNL